MITSSKSPLHVNAATGGSAITPGDTTEVDFNGVYVGGAGNLAVTLLDGSVITLTAVVVGTIYPLRAIKVMSTNTTATNLVGLKW
jgi:archaellum component FlaF (FlaF/FlaG flagellin family)